MLNLNFNPFPEIETKRLFLRRLILEDAPEVLALRGNPITMQYVPRPLCKDIEQAVAHINLINENIDKNTGINWGVTIKENSKMIGIMGHYKISCENFRSEIGYMILPEYNGLGYTTEAVNAILNYGFNTLKLHSIEAIIDPNNIASERVLQKNGFVKEAHLIENEFYEGKFLDTVIYSLLKRNFIQQL